MSDDEKLWDSLTGAFTSAYLMTEGGKHFSHAKRHGTALSAISFRIDNYAEIEAKVGKEPAGQLLAKVAKLVQSTLRAEDSMGRRGDALFTVVSPSTAAEQALAFARRLRERLDTARVTHAGEAIRIRTSIGVSALGNDAADSIEALLKAAMRAWSAPPPRARRERAKPQEDFAATLQRGIRNDIRPGDQDARQGGRRARLRGAGQASGRW